MNVDPDFNLISFVREGGSYCAVLELFAIVYLLRELAKANTKVDKKEEENRALSERVISITTELKSFLFSERRA